MNKFEWIFLALAIILIPLSSAITINNIHAGSCDSFTFNTNVINYTVSENITNTEGMTIAFADLNLLGINYSIQSPPQPHNISICFAFNYQPDNLTLIFYSDIPYVAPVTYQVTEDKKSSCGGGGGGCIASWICDGWSACSPEGQQTRICEKTSQWPAITKYCWAPPVNLTQNCVYTAPSTPINNSQPSSTNDIKTPTIWTYIIIIVIALVIAGIVYLIYDWKKNPRMGEYDISDGQTENRLQ